MKLEAQQKWYNKEKRDYFNMYGYRISVFEVLWKNQVIRFLLIFLALFVEKTLCPLSFLTQ